MKYLLLAAVLIILIPCAMAQQDPLYSQYFNNPMLINPAFAGSNDRLYAGLANIIKAVNFFILNTLLG